MLLVHGEGETAARRHRSPPEEWLLDVSAEPRGGVVASQVQAGRWQFFFFFLFSGGGSIYKDVTQCVKWERAGLSSPPPAPPLPHFLSFLSPFWGRGGGTFMH